ncbi:MAG: L,D-transpeptidase family protein [Candidatus Aegiribacteria sp.]|nr:L,D-transpeptidase family protein [Candidatus Aegiribacteria sp.]
MNSLKTATIVLACVLLAGLIISLVSADALSRKLIDLQLDYMFAMDELRILSSERDTLVDIHSFYRLRADSLDLLKYRLDSLQALMQVFELNENYVGYYLLIDTYQNRFHIRRNIGDGDDILVRSGYCATGKGWTNNDQGQVWDFSTPRGLRYVIEKSENPYWYRPDWYWEEMNIIPPEPDEYIVIPDTISWEEQISFYHDSLTAAERVYVKRVPGALGSYKIDLGGGILIHYGVGRGRNVSHGCIRMGSSDLEALYSLLPVGAPVIIY